MVLSVTMPNCMHILYKFALPTLEICGRNIKWSGGRGGEGSSSGKTSCGRNVLGGYLESGSFRSYFLFPFGSGRFGPGCFSPVSGVSRFGPVGAGRFGPISKVGHFSPIFGMSRFCLIYL